MSETRTIRTAVNGIMLSRQQIVVDDQGVRNWSAIGETTIIIDEKEYKLVPA